MASWKADRLTAKEYSLNNGKKSDRTRLSLSPKSNPPINYLMKRMRDANVPIGYTIGLKEIYFTRLHGTHGDYTFSKIRLSTDIRSWEISHVVLVHELAHHLDEILEITKDDRLRKEKKENAQHMPDGYAKTNFGEYLACGFEIFYFGAKKEKDKMKQKNPRLYRTIETLHRKFSSL